MTIPYWTPRRMRRHGHPTVAAAGDLLQTITLLEQAGCRVLDAHLLPMPRIRVDQCPQGLDTWSHLSPPLHTVPTPTEHYALVGSTLVTWFAVPETRRHA
jgi:hypothetical protein